MGHAATKADTTTSLNNIVGESCESPILLEGILTNALLDTGATVSTVTKSFFDTYLSHLPLVSLENVLNVEVAGGHLLEYHGYVTVRVVPHGVIDASATEGAMLVVDDTHYGKTTPVILGTNILQRIMTSLGNERRKRLPSAWHMAARTVSLRSRRLRRNKGRIACIHNSCNKVTIPANGTVTIHCPVNADFDYHGSVLIDSATSSHLPEHIEVIPALLFYQHNIDVPVRVANNGNRPFTLQPRAICAQMEVVNVVAVDKPNDENDIPEMLFNLDSISDPSQRKEVEDFLHSWKSVFSLHDNDVGYTTAVCHEIKLVDEQPFKQRYRRIPPAMIDEVRTHLQQLYDAGIIRPSHSPYNSNIVLVRKKDGSLRICIDYRQLNKATIRDAYALPRIDQIFDYLSGAKYFTVLDMKSGYHQVPIKEEDIFKTGFTAGPLGHWEFCRLPFGLTNSPATYQRLMEHVFRDIHLDFVQIYLDDVLVFSSSFEEHIDHLKQVFERLKSFNLKLAPKKCKFFQKSVRYLGHIVSQDGISVDPEKTSKVAEWKVPENAKDLHRFLGFANYYRKYIKDFARIARPLTELLSGDNCSRKRKKFPSCSTIWKWEAEQQESFDKLKECLTNAPVLGYPDPDSPFELHIDGSRQALGAVLYQRQNGQLKVIAYASRTLNKAESHYEVHKIEFLALKWAVTERFQDYLYGARFTIYTDNNPLTFVLTSAHLDATGHRWVAALAAFNFDIKYRSGKSNVDADCLSRLDSSSSEIRKEVVQAICHVQQPWIHALSVQIPDDADVGGTPAHWSLSKWEEYQRNDQVISPIIPFVRDGVCPNRNQIPTDSWPLLKEFDKLHIKNNGLYRTVIVNDMPSEQIVLPTCLKHIVLHQLHDNMGHMGRDRTIHLVKERFFWPKMTSEVENYISSCRRCLQRKSPPSRAPLVPIVTTQPLEVVSMDHLTLEPSKGGIQHILAITDLFTRFAVAVPVQNLSAKATAKAFLNNFIVHYGIPLRIHSDQGGAFESKLIKELCSLLGIEKSRTSAYHPEGNGMTERFNRSLLNMLGTLEPHSKLDWKSQVAPLVHAYNCAPHAATGFSPYLLMFGRHPNLPVDVVMGIQRSSDSVDSLPSFVSDLREKLSHSYEVARKMSDISKGRHKQLKDRRCNAAVLTVGDRVLVRKLAFTGKHKLADRWEPDVYVIVKQPNCDIPVYTVQPEIRQQKDGGRRLQRTVHRNHLLPVGSLLDSNVKPELGVQRPKVSERMTEEMSESEESDEESIESRISPDVSTQVPQEELSEDVDELPERAPEVVAGAAGVTAPVSEDGSGENSEESEPEEQNRRYPQRERRPPDRYGYSMSHSSKKLDIIQQLVHILNKE